MCLLPRATLHSDSEQVYRYGINRQMQHFIRLFSTKQAFTIKSI